MKNLLTLMLIFFVTNSLSQTYTYIEPDPAIEKEKKDKEAFFQRRKDNATRLGWECTQRCLKMNIPYSTDANNPKGDCTSPNEKAKCLCFCETRQNDSLTIITQQEKVWRSNILKRQEEYNKKQMKMQQESLNNKGGVKEYNQNTNENEYSLMGVDLLNKLVKEQQESLNDNGGVVEPNQSGIDVGNALIETIGDIFSTIESNQQNKEDRWNSLTPQEQRAAIEASRKADSIKWANKAAADKEEINTNASNRFSIGVYGALENRDFIADLSLYENQDGYGSTNPILLNDVKNKTGYNLGLNLEWTVDPWGIGDQTRRGLVAIGLYYVTYSSPMMINQNYDQSTTYDGNVAMLKFQSIRIAPTLSCRLFRLGRPRDLSGVFFQYGLKADYMFKSTANPVSIDNNSATIGYNSITTTYKITNQFKRWEWGMVLGIRVDLTRHFFINVQYDILGGLNSQILKSEYADYSEYYTFQHKHKTTFGIGISY